MKKNSRWFSCGRKIPRVFWLFSIGIGIGDSNDFCLIAGLGPWTMIIGPHYNSTEQSDAGDSPG